MYGFLYVQLSLRTATASQKNNRKRTNRANNSFIYMSYSLTKSFEPYTQYLFTYNNNNNNNNLYFVPKKYNKNK